ncbi:MULTISPECIES: hypothetical protein [unclassified Bradyrhizobium]
MTQLLERKIDTLARSVAATFSVPADFEERLRLARSAALEIVEARGIAPANFEASSNFLWTSMGRALTGAPRSRHAALTRKTEGEFPGLDAFCRGHYGRDFDSLLEKRGPSGLLKAMKADALRHPKSANRRVAVLHAVIEVEGMKIADLPKALDYAFFVKRALTGWLWAFYGNSPFRAINEAFPGRFLPHHMAQAPMRHWVGKGGRERAAAALREAFSATGYPEDLYPKLMTERFLEEFKLTTPLQKLFGNHFAYLDAAYPGRYRPWELPVTPRGFFDVEANVIEAIRWLVEERLGLALSKMKVAEVWRERVADRVTKDVFLANGLNEIMATYKSPEPVMRMAYPDKFLEWSFQRKGKWDGEAGLQLARRATRWLFEHYLEMSPLDERISCETFRQNGLWGMLTSRSLGFNTSPVAALRNAYPELASQLRARPAPARRRRTTT